MLKRLLCTLLLCLGLTSAPAWAAITAVHTATSATTSIAVTPAVSGNTLVLIVSYYRSTATDAACPTPTDSNGTVAVATAPVPVNLSSNNHDLGIAIFYVTNAASGTHTFTLSSVTESHATLVEFSPMVAASFDVAASAGTPGNSSATSQVTGTTGSTAQASELVVIACTYGVNTGGVADIGWTDPVAGFTTLQKVVNSASAVPTFHAWKEINATGTQAATFNWTTGSATGFMQAGIATFKVLISGRANAAPIFFP